ncbi:Uncharacterized protein GBIM_16989 [Gryllus bimaculatus]|nr:Uncharacterized protein GBIM_16989 [Gryllus bimaculatus]
MAFAAARMILKDKRRKTSKEDFAPRNRSKARNKPADGGGHVNQKGQAGQKTPVTAQKNAQAKSAQKPAQKPPTAQKGQSV